MNNHEFDVIAARNKMRSGSTVPHKISLSGRLIETIALTTESEAKAQNIELVNQIVSALQEDTATTYSRTNLGHEWDGVSFDYLISFIEKFVNHPQSFYTFYWQALVDYLELIKGEHENCIVLLKTLVPRNQDPLLPAGKGLYGRKQNREKTVSIDDGIISFRKNSRVGERKDDEAGIPTETLLALKKEYKGKSISPRAYRNIPGRKPLLILHLLDLPSPHKFAAAYGISFPGSSTSRRLEKLVEYVVNVPYWKNNYGDTSDEDEEETV